MKLSIVLPVVVAIFSGAATARDCTLGLHYCGYNLLKIGMYSILTRGTIRNYRSQIKHALLKAEQPTRTVNIEQSRFNCVEKGGIKYIDFCSGGCREGVRDSVEGTVKKRGVGDCEISCLLWTKIRQRVLLENCILFMFTSIPKLLMTILHERLR
ncbi:uncharacterized protein BDR25DRAFT_350672 [Lindgomyces ingoldianus]|uniref:Uncharacterized protein n=1 Tax=Lindgomyces ingoldianus TaxID=673940 RepID=A0ACB6R7Q0_9PLEO|nr:uncharacterized protein BDR25DRAFT_350672 [Lindgomyces ingoldianus]KAF2475284.1 hypothetical protein BDR25DRAFT_350672 [Lindgomyces ingoldianus]